MVEIVAYRPVWAEEFRQIAADLERALGPLQLRIDHIGSTSVPGLAAKDIIDVQVTVPALGPLAPLESAFQLAGYTVRPEIHCDHRKDPVCDVIMSAAEEWAASTGWRV